MRFAGRILADPQADAGIFSAGAPAIEVEVTIAGRSALVQFEIDTGADVTVLGAEDARNVIGVEYEYLDFRSDPRRIGVRGFGGQRVGVALQARLTLRGDDGDYAVEQPIVFAPPPADRIAPRSLPSLLGRDVLRHFRLELMYGEAPSVLLETL